MENVTVVAEAAPPFIGLWPPERRSAIAQRFYNLLRSHRPPEPSQLVALVRADAFDRLASRWADEATKEQERELLQALRVDREAALAFARLVIERENLPPEERQRLKEERAHRGRIQWMSSQPPSEKQIAYLRALGYQGEVQSKAHASQLIDSLRGAAR